MRVRGVIAMKFRASDFMTGWTKDYVSNFLTEAEAGARMAEVLGERYDVRLSYEPDESIGWELTVVVADTPGAEVFTSRRVADLMLYGDAWEREMADAIVVAAAEAVIVAA
jgi:hypothetical protein